MAADNFLLTHPADTGRHYHSAKVARHNQKTEWVSALTFHHIREAAKQQGKLLSEPDVSSRQRTSRRKALAVRQCETPPERGAQQGHGTVHYLPKGVIIQSPAETERAAREPERSRDACTPPPPAVSGFLPLLLMDCGANILQNV